MLSLILARYRGGGVGALFAERRITRQPSAGLQCVVLEAHKMLEEFCLHKKSVDDVVVEP